MSNLCEPNIAHDNCDFIKCEGIETETEVIETSGTSLTPPGLTTGTIKIPRFLRRVIISGCIKSKITIPGPPRDVDQAATLKSYGAYRNE